MDLAKVSQVLERAMKGLKDEVGTVMEERGKNATGRTMRGTVYRVIGAAGPVTSRVLVGQLEADSHWRYVGSGRGPGGMPPIDRLQDWINAKGLALSAWAVGKTIAQYGSRDYRQGNRNVYEEAIERWEGTGLSDVEGAVMDSAELEWFEIIKQAVRPLA